MLAKENILQSQARHFKTHPKKLHNVYIPSTISISPKDIEMFQAGTCTYMYIPLDL